MSGEQRIPSMPPGPPASPAPDPPSPAPDLGAVDAAIDSPPPPGPAPVAPPPPPVVPTVEAPSSDVVVSSATARIPGAVRDGYHQLPTAPVVTAVSGPVESEAPEWAPAPDAVPARSTLGAWALGLAIVALAASLLVGWMLPVALAAVVTAVVALRRATVSRRVAVWALVLGSVAVAYSAGWLLWAVPQLLRG